ncbi:Cytochrome oxidase assembly factor 4 [Chamberlinius hualienensis]
MMENDEEVDPVIKAISQTGCLAYHNAVQECMFEHKDWRKCQQHVNTFKRCVLEYHERKSTTSSQSKDGQHQQKQL